ncbi:MAG: hypothetical protein HKM95_08445 [Inquilinus sp.]|nr:hypothetical protein [Inquilinus sp.]
MYRHTQPGWTILAFFLAGLLVVAAIALPKGGTPLVSSVLVFLGVLGVLFHSMTVTVDDRSVRWHFGPGFWNKEMPIETIEGVGQARNKWYYGWGIRKVPHGWLYNVSGLSAVEIRAKDRRLIRLGTDEPEALKRAIESRLHAGGRPDSG